jgi:hypothetical protein
MVYFQTKNPNLGKLWRVLQWKMLAYFMAIWYNLRPFVIFCGNLVYFPPAFDRLYQEKSGIPGLNPFPILLREMQFYPRANFCRQLTKNFIIKDLVENWRRRKMQPTWIQGCQISPWYMIPKTRKMCQTKKINHRMVVKFPKSQQNIPNGHKTN